MANRLAARNGGPAGLCALVAILLLGLGLRAGEAWDGRAPVYDAQAYAAIARNLEAGEGFTVGPGATQPSSNYSPGLPLLVAGIYVVSGGPHERLARELLAAIGALAVLFACLIGRRLAAAVLAPGAGASGRRQPRPVVAGLLAALAVAVYPALLEYGGMLMGEPLATTLLAGAVLAILWATDGSVAVGERGENLGRWALAGAVLGGLALVRPEYLAIGLALAAGVALRGVWLSLGTDGVPKDNHTLARALVPGVVLALAIVLVVAPWTVRNAAALDRFVPISTGGGQVLFAGTYLPSDGNPERVGTEVVARNPGLFSAADADRLRLEQILARLAAARHPGMETDEALGRMGRAQLGDDLTDHTSEFAGFVAAKIGRVWAHGPRHVMRTPLPEALHWIVLAFGFLGLGVLAWRRRPEALLIGAIFVAVTGLAAVLVASPRRVLVLIPLLAALAGLGIVWSAAALRFVRENGEAESGTPSPSRT